MLLLVMAVWLVVTRIASLEAMYALEWPSTGDGLFVYQRIWQAAHGDQVARTMLDMEKGEGLWQALHFVPIIALLVPLVRIWPRWESVVVARQVLFCLSAIPLYLIGLRLTREKVLSALVAAAWLFSPYVLMIQILEPRPGQWSSPFLLACFAAVLWGRPLLTLLFAVLALAVREEVVWGLLFTLPALAFTTWRLGDWARSQTAQPLLRSRRARAWTALLGVLISCLLWMGLVRSVRLEMSAFLSFDKIPGILQSQWELVQQGRVAGVFPYLQVLYRIVFYLGPAVWAALFAPLWLLAPAGFVVALGLASSGDGGSARHHAPFIACFAVAWLVVLGSVRQQILKRRPGWEPRLRVALIALAVALLGNSLGQTVRYQRGNLFVGQLYSRLVNGPAEEDENSAWQVRDRFGDARVMADGQLSPVVADRPYVYLAKEWVQLPQTQALMERSVDVALLLDDDDLWLDYLRARGWREATSRPGWTVMVRPETAPELAQAPLLPLDPDVVNWQLGIIPMPGTEE